MAATIRRRASPAGTRAAHARAGGRDIASQVCHTVATQRHNYVLRSAPCCPSPSPSESTAPATRSSPSSDVLANHEPFTDHMLIEWSFAGPAAGVGAKARMHAALPGPKDWIDMEVIESRAPVRTVEESVSAQGKRRTRGTYTLDELPGGGTHVRFELRYLQAPLLDRLAGTLHPALAPARQRARDAPARRGARRGAAQPAGEGAWSGLDESDRRFLLPCRACVTKRRSG